MERKGSIVGTSKKGNFEGVNRFVLKMTATLLMLVDHFGLSLQYMGLGSNYWLPLRALGRLSFPIFCFLIVEGYFYTKDIKKYLARLAVFAVISEVPFDLFLTGKVVDLGHQSIYFTLIFGLLMIWAFDTCLKKNLIPVGAMAAVAFILLGAFSRCDYGEVGVLMVFMFYYFRQKPLFRLIGVGVLNLMLGGYQYVAILSMLLISMYNGENGMPEDPKKRKMLQYFFYAFYPVHLLILFAVRSVL